MIIDPMIVTLFFRKSRLETIFSIAAPFGVREAIPAGYYFPGTKVNISFFIVSSHGRPTEESA